MLKKLSDDFIFYSFTLACHLSAFTKTRLIGLIQKQTQHHTVFACFLRNRLVDCLINKQTYFSTFPNRFSVYLFLFQANFFPQVKAALLSQ